MSGRIMKVSLDEIQILDIFTSPTDLEITIKDSPYGGNFAFEIAHGPGENHKTIVLSKPVFKSRGEALEAIGETLQAVCDRMAAILELPPMRPYSDEIKQVKVLRPELICRILAEVHIRNKTQTHRMPAVTF